MRVKRPTNDPVIKWKRSTRVPTDASFFPPTVNVRTDWRPSKERDLCATFPIVRRHDKAASATIAPKPWSSPTTIPSPPEIRMCRERPRPSSRSCLHGRKCRRHTVKHDKLSLFASASAALTQRKPAAKRPKYINTADRTKIVLSDSPGMKVPATPSSVAFAAPCGVPAMGCFGVRLQMRWPCPCSRVH